jgi:hypothetical protein
MRDNPYGQKHLTAISLLDYEIPLRRKTVSQVLDIAIGGCPCLTYKAIFVKYLNMV